MRMKVTQLSHKCCHKKVRWYGSFAMCLDMLRGIIERLKQYVFDVGSKSPRGKLFEYITRTIGESQSTISVSITTGSRDTICLKGSIAKLVDTT